MLEKVTSNGKKWAERLNRADVMTKYNAYAMIERTHNGYMTRGGAPSWPKFFV